MLKDQPRVVPALSLRDGVLVWTLAIAFGIVGGIVAGIFFVRYHFYEATSALRSSAALDKDTRA